MIFSNKSKNLILAIIVLATVFQASAQKVKYHKFNFFYKQLPSKPLDGKIETYSPKVVIGYEDYASQIEANYNQEVLLANERYQAELDAYNKQSMLNKVVTKEVLKQGEPVYVAPIKPYIPVMPDTEKLKK